MTNQRRKVAEAKEEKDLVKEVSRVTVKSSMITSPSPLSGVWLVVVE